MRKGKTIKIVLKKPGFRPVRMEVDASLENLQALVDGHIEAVTVKHTKPKLVMVVDEEGKFKPKPVNFYVKGDPIVGTAFFCGARGSHFCDIDDAAAERICEVLTDKEEK